MLQHNSYHFSLVWYPRIPSTTQSILSASFFSFGTSIQSKVTPISLYCTEMKNLVSAHNAFLILSGLSLSVFVSVSTKSHILAPSVQLPVPWLPVLWTYTPQRHIRQQWQSTWCLHPGLCGAWAALALVPDHWDFCNMILFSSRLTLRF